MIYNLKRAVRWWIRKSGFDISRFSPPTLHPLGRRRQLIEAYGVQCVLDVGANVGQYGDELRRLGYRGRIISFEPLKAAFGELSERAKGDSSWEVFNMAIGDKPGVLEINVSENLQSSSLHKIASAHLEAAPEARYIAIERVEINTLDSLASTLIHDDEAEVMLKIDTQGHEFAVLEGAQVLLKRLTVLQAELSFHEMYEGERLFSEMLGYIGQYGFRLVSVEPGWLDPRTGEMLQADCIFRKDRPLAP